MDSENQGPGPETNEWLRAKLTEKEYAAVMVGLQKEAERLAKVMGWQVAKNLAKSKTAWYSTIVAGGLPYVVEHWNEIQPQLESIFGESVVGKLAALYWAGAILIRAFTKKPLTEVPK
jgi:hypothetical protein